jgi:hypothetical protein
VLVSSKIKEISIGRTGLPVLPIPGPPSKVTKNCSRVGGKATRKGKNRKLFDKDDIDSKAKQEPEADEEEDGQICAKLEAALVDDAEPNEAAIGKAADGEQKTVAAKVEPGQMDDEPDRMEVWQGGMEGPYGA